MTSEKVIFDLVVLEALASGACCVVSNDGGNKEIIKDGVNGFLIDADDIESSAKKILSINPESVKENAVKTAKQFSVRKMVESYFEVYESLLNEI
jgi:glycosyltransferase involved in cell wall biosynthesis